VALAVGMVLVLLVTALLVAVNAGYARQAAADDVDEAGRYALDALARALRQAGYVDWSAFVAHDPALPPPVQGLDDATLERSAPGFERGDAPAVNGSDVLALHFAAAADGSVRNCAGFPVTEAGRGWSIFYVARAADGAAELRCKYRGAGHWSSEAIIRGVDSFQVLYGIDTDTPADATPNRYLRAADIDALDAALPPEDSASAGARASGVPASSWWRRVRTVRLALLVHSAGRARPASEGARRFDLFGPDYASGADPGTQFDEALLPAAEQGRERRLFALTVALRNAGGGA
jgi:type IV pilus assembly protein PilW